MRITNVNFDTWCKNHSSDHDAKWCRILYPWEVFSLIDYGKHDIGLKQLIRSNRLEYTALMSRFYIGKNGRPNFLIDLKLNAKSKNARWKNILWNTRFHLVASKSGHFITLFTEKRDPAKALLGAFMNCNFSRIEAQRCITYSNLLFRTLVTYRAEELFGDQFNPSPFDWVRGGVRNLTPHRQFRPQPRSMLPLWANKRALWVTARWSEEKAHRLAIYSANQCEELIVVYCHPTFSRHHRCSYPKTKVISLLGFVSGEYNGRKSQYNRQARFLLNNLQSLNIESKKKAKKSRDIRSDILKANNTLKLNIPISLLREAKSGLEIEVVTVGSAAYFFSCANLLNATLSGRYGIGSIPSNLEKAVYSFKRRVGKVVESIIDNPIQGVEIYFDHQLMYVTIDTIQFSCHAIPRTKKIRGFINSKANERQNWSGIRLQPISPMVLDWGRARFIESKKGIS